MHFHFDNEKLELIAANDKLEKELENIAEREKLEAKIKEKIRTMMQESINKLKSE